MYYQCSFQGCVIYPNMINQNILFLAFNFIIKTITLATLFDNLENKTEYTLRKTKPHSVINMFK